MNPPIQFLKSIPLLLLFLPLHAKAQEQKAVFFIGVNPSVTVEPFYEKGEFDVNVFPLVYQKSLSKRLDFRLSSILNLGVRNAGNEISHLGLEMAFPLFFRAKETRNLPSKGFFVAPSASFTRNRLEAHSNVGFWLEPGYNLLIDDRYGLSFGVQLGTTHFNHDEKPDEWGPHFGVKIIFGRWFGAR